MARICRVCSIERDIARIPTKPVVGTCPICRQPHALYPLAPVPTGFNRFCTQWGITDERESFYGYVYASGLRDLTIDALAGEWMDYNRFVRQAEDARDLRETQQDALT